MRSRGRARQEQPPRAPMLPQIWPPRILNALGWCCPARQGEYALVQATRQADSPQKGGHSAELWSHSQRHGANRWRPVPEGGPRGRDVLRGVGLWASVSLHAQWEQRGGSSSTCSCLRPSDPQTLSTGQGQDRGKGPGGRRSRVQAGPPVSGPALLRSPGGTQHLLYRFA